jgi:hypothetical protein
MSTQFNFSFGLADVLDPNSGMEQDEIESLLTIRDREVEDFLSQTQVNTDIKADLVSTQQTTTSGSYTNLATTGPTVTMRTGTSALVTVSSLMADTGIGASVYMSYAVSGSTTLAAADSRALRFDAAYANQTAQMSFQSYLTTLVPGTNTFTAKYKEVGGTGSFANRLLTVQLLN